VLPRAPGAGWYQDDETRTAQIDPTVEALIERVGQEAGTICR